MVQWLTPDAAPAVASPVDARIMYEDPELAQARNFVRELTMHAQAVLRRRDAQPVAAESARHNAELAAVRRQIDQLHERFPTLRTDGSAATA